MKSKRNLKRILSLLLACIMILNVPVSILATEELQTVDAVVLSEDNLADAEENEPVFEEPAEVLTDPETTADTAVAAADDLDEIGDELLEDDGLIISDSPDEPEIPTEEAAETVSEEDAETVVSGETEVETDAAEEELLLEAQEDQELVVEGEMELAEEADAPRAAAAASDKDWTFSIEMYDENGNGTFLLEPAAVTHYLESSDDYTRINKFLNNALTVLGHDGERTYEWQGWSYQYCTSILGVNNGSCGSSSKWGFRVDNAYSYKVDTAKVYMGSVVRAIIGPSGYSNTEGGVNKDELLKMLARVTDEVKETKAYEDGLAVVLNQNATDADVAAAVAALKVVPATDVTLSVNGVSVKKLNLKVDDIVTVSAALVPEDSTDEVTWSSDNAAVAAVDGNGGITAISVGTANVTATVNDKVSRTLRVNVSEQKTSTDLSESALTITVEQYDAAGNGNYLVDPFTVTYDPDNYSYVNTIFQNAIGEGNYELEWDNFYHSTCKSILGVQNGSCGAESKWVFLLDNQVVDYERGKPGAGSVLRAVFSPSGTGSEAGVNKDTLLRGLARASAEVKATADYREGLETVLDRNATEKEVYAAWNKMFGIRATGMELQVNGRGFDELHTDLEKTIAVSVALIPGNSTDVVTWSSDNEAVATVDENGVITAIAGGTAYITARANDDVSRTFPVTCSGKYVSGDPGYEDMVVSVEVYDENGNGRFLLEPRRVGYLITTDPYPTLKYALRRAFGAETAEEVCKTTSSSQNHIIAVKDSSQPDGFLDNYDIGEDTEWIWIQSGVQRTMDGNTYGTGTVERLVYDVSGTNPADGSKDSLLKVMANMNSNQRLTQEYANAKEVALKIGATTEEIAAAKAALEELSKEPDVPAVDIKITDSIDMTVGESQKLTAVLTPSYAKDTIQWSVTNKKVAQVDENGVVTALQAGFTNVKATVNGHSASCLVTVKANTEPYVYFEYEDGRIQLMKDGAFTLGALDVGVFKVANVDTALDWPSDANEEKLTVYDPWTGEENVAFHWYVNKYTGAWQPSGVQPTKQITVNAGDFSTKFTIHYEEVSGVTELRTYVDGKRVTLDTAYETVGCVEGVAVTTLGLKDGEWMEVPVQALEYTFDDIRYNFRFIGNAMKINRKGTHIATVKLKGEGVSAKYTATCGEVRATDMKVIAPATCVIDEWDAAGGYGEGHYVGLLAYEGYTMEFTPENATNRDTTWECLNPDVAYVNVNNDIIPVKAGTAKFRITNTIDPDLKDVITIKFVYKNPLTAASTEDAYAMETYDYEELVIGFTPSNATEQRFTWTYSQDGIVEVKDKINSSVDGMTSWTIHTMEALKPGVVTVTGTPYDQTAGCRPVTFTVVVNDNKADAKAVAEVYKKMAAIGEVTLNSEAAVAEARTAYEALTDAQKALLGEEKLKELKAALETAEKRLDELHVHTWDAGTVTKAATCTAAGVKTYKCSCGAVKTEAIPAGGHKYGAWAVTSKATVFAAEVQKHSCSICGYSETKSAGEKLTPVLEVPGKLSFFSIKKGKTAKFVLTMANGDTVTSVTSSNAKYVKVSSYDKKGNISLKAVKAGSAKVTVKLASGKTRTYTVKVTTGTVKTTKVTVASTKITLEKGKTQSLKPVLTPFTSTQKITYKSSNKKVATVTSAGKIKAVAPGKANITVTSGSKKVVIAVTVPGIANVKSSVSVKKNKTLTLNPKLYGISGKVTYTSSDTKVATVNANGKIKGIKKGTATISIKAGAYTYKCKVQVK